MSDWPEVSMSELATIDIGGTPSRAIPAFWAEKPNGYPWISIADLKGKYVSDTKEHITALGVRSSNVKLIPERTTVMSFKLTVGRAAITATEMYCNEAIAIFQPNDGRLDARWLYHALPRAAGSVVTDTAVKGATLNKAKMAEMSLQLPPPAEQAIIAQVLDTLDTAIHETEAIIAKFKAVKQGLLHDLLTRGIDANGELRPPQAAAPQLYKESPLGWIPKDWQWCETGSVLTGIDAGKSPDCQDVPATGDQWGVLKVGAVHPDCLRLHENKVVERESLKNAAYLVRDGDLLFSRANTFELVGFVCHVTKSPGNLMLSDKTLRLRVNGDRMLTRFLFWQLQHPKSREQIEIAATGTSGSMKNISQTGVERIKVVRPPRDEQREIDDRVDAVARRYALEVDELAKLKRLKAGLMDDLLTGRVRVTPLLEAEPA